MAQETPVFFQPIVLLIGFFVLCVLWCYFSCSKTEGYRGWRGGWGGHRWGGGRWFGGPLYNPIITQPVFVEPPPIVSTYPTHRDNFCRSHRMIRDSLPVDPINLNKLDTFCQGYGL